MSDNTKAGAEPSMDDILASIRKILNEDDVPGAQPTSPAPPPEPLMLTEEMLVAEPTVPALATAPPLPILAMAPPLPTFATAPPPGVQIVPPPEPVVADTVVEPPPPLGLVASTVRPAAVEPVARQATTPMSRAELVAPAAAAAAAASMGELLRAVSQERGSAVTRGGPTIEDVVREEMRPILKEWLDAHLPSIVERAVRAEIERVVGRSV